MLLYELLAGSQPFDSRQLRQAGLLEIQRKLREEEPPRPSLRISGLGVASTTSAANRRLDLRGLQRELKGDLDWITMKALEKDRVRRYETAHALALDVERHLNDEPVLAGPPSASYRLGKLIRRHKPAFVATAAVALALVGAVVGTSWALLRAVRAERLAAAEGGADHPSTLNSVNNLAELNDQRGRDAEAEALHRKARDGRRRVLGSSHARTIESMERLAANLSNQGRFAEAERLAATAAAEGAKSLGEGHLTTLFAQDTGARALLGLEHAGEAETSLRRLLAVLEEKKERGEDAGEGDALAQIVSVHLGMALAAQGRRAEAEPLLLEALPKLPPREADTLRAIRFVVRFYDGWERSQPNQGYAARAAEWRQRLPAVAGPPAQR